MLAVLAFLACEPFGPGETLEVEDIPVEGTGRIRLEPGLLDFGHVSVLQDGTATATFTVRNTESWAVEVVGLDHVSGDGDVFTTDAPAIIQLGPHGSNEVEVTFTPNTARNYSGDLFPNGQVTLGLTGHGTAPVASLWPSDLDWGSVPVGCDLERTVQVLNAGDEDLVVADVVTITDTDFTVPAFSPVTLAPGETTELRVLFAPDFDGLQATVLHVETNDPISPVATLALSAAAFDGDPIIEHHDYTPSTQADILLVQDSSSTVTSRLADASSYLQGFLETLESAGVDWQVSLVREDQDCTASPSPWLHQDDGAARAATVLNTELARVGGGSNKLLETAVASLERTDPGDCMDGFLRQDAQLHTILLGDRTEASPSSADDYVAAMATKVQDSADLVVSAVMGHGNNGCEDLGQAADAVAQTGGADLDLCDPDWGLTFAALASISTSAVPRAQAYTLSEEPVEGTLTVWANGRELTGWAYEPADRRLTVHGDDAGLETGSELAVSYVGASVCSQ